MKMYTLRPDIFTLPPLTRWFVLSLLCPARASSPTPSAPLAPLVFRRAVPSSPHPRAALMQRAQPLRPVRRQGLGGRELALLRVQLPLHPPRRIPERHLDGAGGIRTI